MGKKLIKITAVIIAGIFFACGKLYADTTRVLFVGNSYTYFNNLPLMFKSFSEAGGKQVAVDYSAPGGYSLEMHLSNPETLDKINSGLWDYVVLQEQSQMPAIDFYRYNSMYPSARKLDSMINARGGETVFYMTWGRRYGGQQCINSYCSPVFTGFYHMQDSLSSAYTQISNKLGAITVPVGNAWRYSVSADSNIVLWDSDNSHPSLEGSYLAAAVFYRKIFNQSPLGIPYSGGLSQQTATFLQGIASGFPLKISGEKTLLNSFELFECYPNPFNSVTNIEFKVPLCHSGESRNPVIKIKVFDISGKEVKTLVNEYKQAGTYKVRFNAEGLSSGVYFAKMTAVNFTAVKKIVLIR